MYDYDNERYYLEKEKSAYRQIFECFCCCDFYSEEFYYVRLRKVPKELKDEAAKHKPKPTVSYIKIHEQLQKPKTIHEQLQEADNKDKSLYKEAVMGWFEIGTKSDRITMDEVDQILPCEIKRRSRGWQINTFITFFPQLHLSPGETFIGIRHRKFPPLTAEDVDFRF